MDGDADSDAGDFDADLDTLGDFDSPCDFDAEADSGERDAEADCADFDTDGEADSEELKERVGDGVGEGVSSLPSASLSFTSPTTVASPLVNTTHAIKAAANKRPAGPAQGATLFAQSGPHGLFSIETKSGCCCIKETQGRKGTQREWARVHRGQAASGLDRTFIP